MSVNNNNYNRKVDTRESPVKYESTLKISEMSTYTIKRYSENNDKIEKDCLIFTGNEGLEGFVHVYQRFNNACSVFEINDTFEKVELFEKILEDDALLYWNMQIRSDFDNDVTEEIFESAVRKMKIAFGGGEKARDHIIEYMKSDSCRKPKKSTVRDHSRRMQALMKLANEAEGTESPLNEAKFNKILLNSFPSEWKTAFIIGGGNISNMSTEDLINHFSEVKIEYDNKEAKNKGQWSGRGNAGRGFGRGNRQYGQQFRRNFRNGGRGRGFVYGRNPGRGRGGRGGRGPNPEMQCPLHPFSNHLWKNCFENQRGERFRPRQMNNQRRNEGNVNYNQGTNANNDYENEQRGRNQNDTQEERTRNSWSGAFTK
jgi:hypothetical protein